VHLLVLINFVFICDVTNIFFLHCTYISTTYEKVKFTLEQVTKAQTGVEVHLYCFFNLGDRWGGWSVPRPGRFTLGKDWVFIV
jgi:hypothetical protein